MDSFPESDMTNLPPGEAKAFAGFVSAVNRGDLSGVLALFAPDAQVNDQLRNFWGLDAISEWLEREIIGERVQIAVVNVRRHYDTIIAATELRGDFEVIGLAQPVCVDMYFTIHDGQIVRLQLLMVRESGEGVDLRKIS
jgi:hypothetical protein